MKRRKERTQAHHTGEESISFFANKNLTDLNYFFKEFGGNSHKWKNIEWKNIYNQAEENRLNSIQPVYLTNPIMENFIVIHETCK